ncbi:DUF3263 domain-containing protein [Actinomadura sp. DSM 109109]|nr:DUF3263 domain-containing protein [Actinomadura lepetitiana]
MRAANSPGDPRDEVPPQDRTIDDGRPPRPANEPGEVEGGADDAAFSAGGLGDRDRRILAFERQWWKYAGAKEQAIRETFDMSATRYYQLLNILIDRPEALECDPMLVKRLRRMRTQRQRGRAARRLGIRP